MRILIADDHSLFRGALKSLLLSQDKHQVVGEARNGREAVALARQLRPDLVLMDLSMPDLDGLAATRILMAETTDIKVVILTASEDDQHLLEAMKSGAQGYLLKNLEADKFFTLLDGVARGEPAITPALARKLIREFPTGRADNDPDALTEREREVLEQLVGGVTSNRDLADRLGVSENTVKFHVRNILAKLHVSNRAQEQVGLNEDQRISHQAPQVVPSRKSRPAVKTVA
jgi:DNA-binding NarL/FixJ family response regulator